MVTIFLLLQLVSGQLHEVDAFTSREQCEESKAKLDTTVALARAQRPELPALVTECRPFAVSLSGA